MINRRRSGARGTPAKVNATAGLEASEGVNSASVSDGSHESVYLGPFCVPTPELFAVAGVWRSSDEWGDCYSMVMKDGTGAAAEVHSRMPVILRGDQYPTWEHGSAAEALTLCELPYQRDIKVDRTTVPWVRTGR